MIGWERHPRQLCNPVLYANSDCTLRPQKGERKSEQECPKGICMFYMRVTLVENTENMYALLCLPHIAAEDTEKLQFCISNTSSAISPVATPHLFPFPHTEVTTTFTQKAKEKRKIPTLGSHLI